MSVELYMEKIDAHCRRELRLSLVTVGQIITEICAALKAEDTQVINNLAERLVEENTAILRYSKGLRIWSTTLGKTDTTTTNGSHDIRF